MTSRGVVYVATKHDRYLEEAFLSAESIKNRLPDLSITLFTDRADHALCRAGVFDRVEVITADSGFRSSWADGQISRLRCLPKTPYEYTLHLDTDTRVLTDALPQLFDILNNFELAMVEDRADYSLACKQSKLRMFNAGLILYRATGDVRRWLETWIEATVRNFRMAVEQPLPPVPILAHITDEETKRHLLSMDQISLVEMLAPGRNRLGLKAGILDHFWNYRGPLAPGDRYEQIRILHSDDLRQVTRPDILSIASGWSEQRNPNAEILYDYVASFEPQYCKPRSWLPWKRSQVLRKEWATRGLKKADLHLQYGQTDKAVAFLSKEDGPEMLTGVARAELMHGRVAEALPLARAAQSHDPRSPYANLVLGQILLEGGQPLEAIPFLDVAARGGAAGADFLVGQAWFAAENYRGAAAAYWRALRDNPAPARSNLVASLLGLGQYDEAVAQADQLLQEIPWHVPALAFKGVALAELGQDTGRLFDHDALTKCEVVSPPPDYDSLESFNSDLVRAIVADPSLVYEPRGHTTRFGRQTADLANHEAPPIRALNHVLLAIAKQRMDALQRSDHPFSRAVPRLYRLYSWAVIMDNNGHQTPHIHSNGWLSGVYYVDVPEEIRADDSEQNGWLEFGQSEARWHRKAKLPYRAIQPRPGLAVTFPSYFWHNTRPLQSTKPRISFAFDIVPV